MQFCFAAIVRLLGPLIVAVLSTDSSVNLKSTRIDLLVDVFGGEADDKFQCASYGMKS